MNVFFTAWTKVLSARSFLKLLSPTHLIPDRPERKFQSVKDKNAENKIGTTTNVIKITFVGSKNVNAFFKY